MDATEASESNLECPTEACSSETKEEEDGNSSAGEYVDSPENGVACEQENEEPEESVQTQSSISQEGKPFAAMEGELDFEDEVNSEEKRKDSSESAEQQDVQQSDAKDKLNTELGEINDECNEGDEKGKKDDSIEEGEDDGEITDDDDLEEGEVKDFTPAPKQQSRQAAVCRFFNRGQCTWGHSCRFLHLSVSEKGHYNMFGPPNPRYSPMYPPGNGPIMAQVNVPIIAPRSGPRGAPEFLSAPPPLPPPPMEPTPVESAWERGLRQAKELVKKANKRKEEEPDFEEKRLNLSIDVNEKNIPDYDKENEYLDKPYKRQSDMHSYKYDDQNDVFDNEERTAREHWRGGRYENFEIRWTRDDLGDHRRDRSRGRRVSNERDRDKFLKHGRGKERWRDDRLFEVQHGSTRSRADDWIDPWRRSKTPKTGGRRTRSRSGSYSSVSSYSYSDRSSRSSCSYSRSSSRSSGRSSRSPSVLQKRKPSPTAEALSPKPGPNRFTSAKKKLGQRSSSSRSMSRTPSISRSRSYSRSLSMDSVSSASSSVTHSSSASESVRNRNAHVSILRKSDDKPLIEKSDSKGGPSSLYEEMQRHTRHYDNSGDANDGDVNTEIASIPEPMPAEMPTIPNVHHLLPSMDKMKEPVKGLHKQQIKLTLLNKPPPAKLMNLPKKELENLKSDALKLEPTTQSGIKRPLSPPSLAGSKISAPVPKKSASSRRDELLKQLKAVEDAIARKRAKFC